MSDKVMVTVRVGEDTKSRLDKLCEENGLKMRWVVEQAIIQYCDEHETKPPSEETRPLNWSLSNIRQQYGNDAARRFCDIVIEEIDKLKDGWESDASLEVERWMKVRDEESVPSMVGGGGSKYYTDACFVTVYCRAKQRFMDEFGDKF